MALFDEISIDDVKFDDLVGEGKKFKTNDELARGKVESDRVIKAREDENEQLREALAEAEERARLALQAAANRQPPQSGRPAGEPEPAASAPTLTDEDLAARIRALTKADSEQERAQRNADEVVARLTELYGSEDKANEVINAKAKELGLPVSFFLDVAKQSPKAFYAQIGVDVKATPSAQAPHSNVSTLVLADTRNGVKEGTYAWYEQIRATEGNTVYFSPKIQNQLMKDAQRLGDAFYS